MLPFLVCDQVNQLQDLLDRFIDRKTLDTVMSVCLIALMIVWLIYCILYIFVILIDIILVMSDVDYLYSFYVATLCIERVT